MGGPRKYHYEPSLFQRDASTIFKVRGTRAPETKEKKRCDSRARRRFSWASRLLRARASQHRHRTHQLVNLTVLRKSTPSRLSDISEVGIVRNTRVTENRSDVPPKGILGLTAQRKRLEKEKEVRALERRRKMQEARSLAFKEILGISPAKAEPELAASNPATQRSEGTKAVSVPTEKHFDRVANCISLAKGSSAEEQEEDEDFGDVFLREFAMDALKENEDIVGLADGKEQKVEDELSNQDRREEVDGASKEVVSDQARGAQDGSSAVEEPNDNAKSKTKAEAKTKAPGVIFIDSKAAKTDLERDSTLKRLELLRRQKIRALESRERARRGKGRGEAKARGTGYGSSKTTSRDRPRSRTRSHTRDNHDKRVFAERRHLLHPKEEPEHHQ